MLKFRLQSPFICTVWLVFFISMYGYGQTTPASSDRQLRESTLKELETLKKRIEQLEARLLEQSPPAAEVVPVSSTPNQVRPVMATPTAVAPLTQAAPQPAASTPAAQKPEPFSFADF